MDRFRNSIPNSTHVSGNKVKTSKNRPEDERVQSHPLPPNVTFTTTSTLGGHVTNLNVTGDYTTYGVDDDELVAKVKGISTLDKLSYADGASWNPTLACMSGTRVATLSLILQWSRSVDQHNILWLKGVAGSGKSAIAHAVAQMLHADGLLTSSFFFDRESPSCNTPRLLFTTIARDMARRSPTIAEDICATVESEPALASAHISRQFEAFLKGPLCRHPAERPVIVVIDALDESIRDESDTGLLTILRDGIAKLPSNFRLFLTSRPTRVIERFLSQKDHISSLLLDIGSAENRRDIAAYVDAMLLDAAIGLQMGAPWPDEALIRDLKLMADGLFIWITTVFSYLRNAHKPRAKLRALLSKYHPHGPLEPTKKIDALYGSILEVCGDWDDPDFRDDYALFMGAVMAVKRPLSLATLRALHGDKQELLLPNLPQRFGSVLVGLHNEHEPIHTLHLSFREFITARAADNADTRKFFLSEKEHSQRVAGLCLRAMIRELADTSITGVGFLAKDEDDEPGIPQLAGVPEHLLYACESWGDHIHDIEGPINTGIMEILQEFLLRDDTTWVEIVSSQSIFRGSLAVWQWLQDHDSPLRVLLKDESQALILHRLSCRLSYDGRHREALTAIQEGSSLCRALATERPATFNARLALSLNHLSIRLSDLGRREEALAAIQEAASLRRTLAIEQPAVFNVDLAKSLNNLSSCLSVLGRREDALTTIQEAVALRRDLALEQPAMHNADLARSLNNLSGCFSDLGRREEALTSIQEAASLRRALATEQPAAFNFRLANSLNTLSVCLSDLGRPKEALSVIQEAVGLYRTLAAERPAIFNANLALSLNILSNRLSEFDRREEALEMIWEAVTLRRALVAERPATFSADLAHSLNNLSLRLSDSGRHREALIVIEEAIELLRVLATDFPATYNADLALSLHNLSESLSTSGQREGALSIIQEAVSLRRNLAAGHPAAYNADLAMSLNNLSHCFSDLQQHEEALVAIQESVVLRRRLAAERPAVFNAKLANSLSTLSSQLSDRGRREEALAADEEAVGLHRALAAERPAAYNAHLARSLRNLSISLSALARYEEALWALRESANLYTALATEQPQCLSANG
ncbi:hypothetical protein HWV62_45591 [Athelia sp. TMB]|nr:hypothetical protein HWV62_45591 [Athelia sp. TMB]